MESAATPHKSELRKTPLNGLHRRLGAKMVNFGGWDMPVEYPSSGGLIAEHRAVRGSVGVFDVSHMGDIRIRSGGKPGGALAAVQHISMNDASKLAIGQAHYSAMLYPQGTFVDDVIVHRLSEDGFLLVINAGTREKDINWVRENTKSFDCVVEELSDAYTQLAIQGPQAVNLLQQLTDAELSTIKNYWFMPATVCGLKNTLIARTGYTGEDGFEIYVPSDVATSEKVWNQVMEAGREFAVVPCGLGCRNTLRLESKMALYGHEISEKINVWEAALDRYCKMEKGDFLGRAALEQARAAGLRRTLVGIEMIDRGIARDEYCCCNEAGDAIGVVTSGSPSPTLGKNIALAYVPPAYSTVGTVLYVEIRGRKCKALVVPTPFYKRPKKTALQQVS
ncbi:MAG: glycine cleavage system aminomethyltransferase GcvT [Acidobacteria bacterium]|nr:MAG: glycine cleavage system aminomethyltransferase GcvT [Acidobacteriota bacterium]PYU51008.1 MAG: glycine cleavage system aminomethyltransferase GcvT [Acidobacteriota bacterium]PYU75602.1 MAG: glycine cleavage system aminomethyltransferase GcvT [Acidobacteriota bacterium]